MGLFLLTADREVTEVREYDTNVDYGFISVDKIEERPR